MTTYDDESLFTNIPLNEAINICLWRHMMLSLYSPTSLLMKLLIFVYDDIWCWMLSHYSPTSLLMMLLIFVYVDTWCWVIIQQHPLNEAVNICWWRHMMLSQYSPTSLLMKLLIFVYDDIWCWFVIHQHPS